MQAQDKKERKLTAICNICLVTSVIGILIMTTGKEWASVVCGYVLAEVGAFGGVMFGLALECVQRANAEKQRREQRGIEPTSEQKAVIRAHMLLPETWLVQAESDTDLTVVYRHGKNKKKLDKRIDRWKEDKDAGKHEKERKTQGSCM